MTDLTLVQALIADVQDAVQNYRRSDSLVDYKKLQKSIRGLQLAAASPADTLFNFRLQVVGNMAIVMLNEMGALEKLNAACGTTMTANDLALSTGCDHDTIARLMRVATALGFADEVGEQQYRKNRVTTCLTQPGWQGALRWMDIIYPVAGNVRHFLSSTTFAKNPQSTSETAFEFAHGGKSMWKVIEEAPDQRRNFDLWMHERRKHEETLWHRRYPPVASLKPETLNNDPDAVLMVDVGGANGSQLVNFKEQFPHLPGRLILQDLPESVQAAKPTPGIEVQAYDFFTPQPVKGARYYYFRNVFHNWPNDKCAEILRNVAPAMDSEYSTLLIDDYVLPKTGVDVHSAIADIHMMLMFKSSERTAGQYEEMLRDANLKVVSIFPAGVNEESIIEIKVAKQ